MNIIRHSTQLAEEYLEDCVEEYEVRIAIDFKNSNREEYSGTAWELDVERDELIEDINDGIYSTVHEDLKNYLEKRGITLESKSDDYTVLARKFLESRINALGIAIDSLSGKKYTYKNKAARNNKNKSSLAKRTNRKATIKLQYYVDVIARKIMANGPNIAKYVLAEDVSTELEKQYDITRKPSTILREYLDKYPNF